MRQDLSATPDVVEAPAGRSRLLSRLYRDVGLAAVAAELELPASAFDLEVGEFDRARLALSRAARGCSTSPRDRGAS